MQAPKNGKGFTLIEIMIVVAIIGIISAIAYPSYLDTVRRSNRSDAKAELNDAAQQLQRCFTVFSAYNSENCGAHTELIGDGFESEARLYTVTLTAVTATTFELTATPVAGTAQEQDLKCTTLTLTHAGVKEATGSDSDNCW